MLAQVGGGWKQKCMHLFPSPNFGSRLHQEGNFLELIRGHFAVLLFNFLSKTGFRLSIALRTAEIQAPIMPHPQNSSNFCDFEKRQYWTTINSHFHIACDETLVRDFRVTSHRHNCKILDGYTQRFFLWG